VGVAGKRRSDVAGQFGDFHFGAQLDFIDNFIELGIVAFPPLGAPTESLLPTAFALWN
jgi:hypothetical protein